MWEAAKRFAGMAIQKGIDVQVALLPGKMDPDDYITECGGDAFVKGSLVIRIHSCHS